jgi:hypothetical protein
VYSGRGSPSCAAIIAGGLPIDHGCTTLSSFWPRRGFPAEYRQGKHAGVHE